MEIELYDPYFQLISRNEREPFGKLFAEETLFMAEPGFFHNRSNIAFRGFAVSLIQQISGCNDFDAFVPYLAMTYFDRIVSRHEIPNLMTDPEENKYLFVICCLVVAWKMRKRSFKLSSFLRAWKLTAYTKKIIEMEYLVCELLDWRIRSLTAICFAEYFIPLLKTPPGQRFARRPVRQIIIKTQANTGITQYRPSTIAAAAVLTASSKYFPAQFYRFKRTVLYCVHVKGRKREILECMDSINTLYIKKREAVTGPPGSGIRISKPSQPETGDPQRQEIGEISSNSPLPESLVSGGRMGEGTSSSARGKEPMKSETSSSEEDCSLSRRKAPGGRSNEATSSSARGKEPSKSETSSSGEDLPVLECLSPGGRPDEAMSSSARGEEPAKSEGLRLQPRGENRAIDDDKKVESAIQQPGPVDDNLMDFKLEWNTDDPDLFPTTPALCGIAGLVHCCEFLVHPPPDFCSIL